MQWPSEGISCTASGWGSARSFSVIAAISMSRGCGPMPAISALRASSFAFSFSRSFARWAAAVVVVVVVVVVVMVVVVVET